MNFSTRSILAALTLVLASGATSPAPALAADCEASIANGSAFRGAVRRELKKKGYRIVDEDQAELDVSVDDERPSFIEAWLGLSGRRVTVQIDLGAAKLQGGDIEYNPHSPPKRKVRKAYVKSILAAQIPECR